MSVLYVVATPIGNLEDISLRGIRMLSEVAQVFAEDTRHTRILFQRHGIQTPLCSLHAHNESRQCEHALAFLEAGDDIALVSDAGTPLVSDPGAQLVRTVIEAGHRVESIPGASAMLAALSISGFDALPAVLLGFLPRRTGAAEKIVTRYLDDPATLVLFESPKRVPATLQLLHRVLGDRQACVARELTKLHEEVLRGELSVLTESIQDALLGEVTLVVKGAMKRAAGELSEPVQEEIAERLEAGESPKEIAAELASAGRGSKRSIYQHALMLRGEGPSQDA